MSKLATENDGHNFILSIIGVLSKYGWLFPLESKQGNESKGVLTKLFEQIKRRPVMVQTDKETVFLNSHVQNFLKKYQIRCFTRFSEQKASIVERFKGTNKRMIFRIFTRNNNRRYTHFLKEIAHQYNNSCYKSIKMKLIKISNKNEPQIWINSYENKFKNPQTALQQSWFSAGDLMHICIEPGPFKWII